MEAVFADAFDTEGIANCLELLKKGKAVDIPIYDFVTHQRSTEVRKVSFSLAREENVKGQAQMEGSMLDLTTKG